MPLARFIIVKLVRQLFGPLFRLLGKFFYYLFAVPLVFLSNLFKATVEKFANSIELFVYRFRNPIVFISITYLLSLFFGFLEPTSRQNIQDFFNFIFHPLQKIIGVNYFTTNSFWIFVIIIIFEFIGQIRKLFADRLQRLKIITPSERLFSLLPYFWIWTEITPTYFDYLIDFLEGSVSPEQKITIVEACARIFAVTTHLPGHEFGLPGYGIYWLFYFGIGRNKEKFSFFTRYHFINCILTTGIWGFVSHLFFLWLDLSPSAAMQNFIGFTIYGCFIGVMLTGIITTILGRETEIPFIHQAIFYHTGRREDDGTINLDDVR